MKSVRTIKPASPEQAPVTIESAELTPQVGASAPVHVNDNVRRADDKAGVGAIDSLGMGGRTSAAEIPQSRTVSFDDKVAEVNARKPVSNGGLPRIELSEAMARLIDGDFSQDAQAKYAQKLASVDSGDAAYMARALRQAVPRDILQKASTVSNAFAQHGLKLDPFAKANTDTFTASLDRSAFRDHVKEIIDGTNGVLTRRDVLKILDSINHVSDLQDLEFARKELDKRVIAGQLKIAPGVDKLLHGFFDERLDVKVGNTELGLAAYRLRQAVARADAATTPADKAKAASDVSSAKATLLRLVTRAMDDKASPDAAFYAKRVINRELCKGTCAHSARAQELRSELVDGIASRLGDRLDRKAQNAAIDAQLASGEITPKQALLMRIGVATSYSNADLRYTYRDFDVVLHTHLLDTLLALEIEIAEEMRHEQQEAEERRHEDERAQVRVQEDQRQLRLQQQRLAQQQHDIAAAGLRRAEEDKQVVATSYQSAAAAIESQAPSVTPTADNDNYAYANDNGNRAAGEASEMRGKAEYWRGQAQAVGSSRR